MSFQLLDLYYHTVVGKNMATKTAMSIADNLMWVGYLAGRSASQERSCVSVPTKEKKATFLTGTRSVFLLNLIAYRYCVCR